jgi:hypothetical protein
MLIVGGEFIHVNFDVIGEECMFVCVYIYIYIAVDYSC